jgi:hypothetical protein
MLWYIANAFRAAIRYVRQFDPNDHGGRRKGAWHYGLRIFAHESDMMRIEMLYASCRNQSLKGASRITGTAEFGQDQRAYRINYLEGFTHEISTRLQEAERAAQAAREAEQERLADEALLAGGPAVHSVALVIRGRNEAVKAAFDLAIYGIDAAERARRDAQMVQNRIKWDADAEKARERRAAHRAEHESCPRCQAAKSGYCNDRRDLRPVQGRAYHESVGSGYYSVGRRDGAEADLGLTAPQVSRSGRRELES